MHQVEKKTDDLNSELVS